MNLNKNNDPVMFWWRAMDGDESYLVQFLKMRQWLLLSFVSLCLRLSMEIVSCHAVVFG